MVSSDASQPQEPAAQPSSISGPYSLHGPLAISVIASGVGLVCFEILRVFVLIKVGHDDSALTAAVNTLLAVFVGTITSNTAYRLIKNGGSK